ncbi:MAG: PGF-pre-PGF domain-containing protein [Candidatus Woesearchaeota archaeon]
MTGEPMVRLKKSLGLKKLGFLKLDVKVEVDTIFALAVVGVLIAAALVISGINGAPKIGENGIVGQAVAPLPLVSCEPGVEVSSVLLQTANIPVKVGSGSYWPTCAFVATGDNTAGKCTMILEEKKDGVWVKVSDLISPVGCQVGNSGCEEELASRSQSISFDYVCNAEGTAELRCSVGDTHSNSGLISCVPPRSNVTIQTLSPASDSIINGPVTFSCSATADLNNIQSARFYLKPQGETDFVLNYSTTNIGQPTYALQRMLTLSPKDYYWYCSFTSTDYVTVLSNVSKVTVPAAPTVYIGYPLAANARAYDLSLRYSTTGNPTICKYGVDSGSWVSDPGCDGTTFSTNEGTHTITVSATNSIGTITVTKTFTVNTPLTVTAVSPNLDNPVGNNPVSFVYQVSTPATVNNCSLFVNGVRVAVDTIVDKDVDQEFTWSVNNIDNEWYVQCSAGTKSAQSGTLPFFVLNLTEIVLIPIQVTALSPSSNYTSTTTNVVFKANVATISSVNYCSLFVDGAIVSNNSDLTSGQNLNVSFAHGLTSGVHSWYVLCTDIYVPPNTGQSVNRLIFINTTSSAVVTHETDAPVVMLLSPANNAKDTDGVVQFSYSVRDNSTVTNCSLLVEGVKVAIDSSVTRSLTQLIQYNFAEGNYSWAVACTDQYGNRGVSSQRLIVVDLPNVEQAPPVVNSYYDDKIVTRTVQTWATIPAERVVRMTLNTKGPVYQILFESIDETSDARLQVLDLRKRPDGVEGIDKIVYGYMEITPQNLGSLKQSNIFFRVFNSWLESKGLSPEDIVLYRYHDGNWNTLETEVLSAEAGYSTYQASTPGFSYFLVGEKGAADTSVDTPEVIDKQGTFAGTNNLPEEQGPTRTGGENTSTSFESGRSGVEWVIVLGIIIAIAVGGFVMWKGRGAKRPPLTPPQLPSSEFKLPDFK